MGQLTDSTIIEASNVRYFDSLNRKCFLYCADKYTVKDADIPYLAYPDTSLRRKSVPVGVMEKDCFIRFTVTNSADTAREFFFLPGYHLRSLKLYAASPRNYADFAALPPDTHATKIFEGARYLRIAPHDTVVFFAKFNFARTYLNSYAPRLIEKGFFPAWLMMAKNAYGPVNIFTYLATGIMLLMIFYAIALFIQNQHTEYLFYSAYALCTMAMIFLKSFFNFRTEPFFILFEEYLDFMIMCISVYFYLAFIRKFLNTGIREPFLEKMLRYTAGTLTALLILFSYIYFFTDKYVILNTLENNVIKVLIFVISAIVITYSFKKKDPLLNYLAAGNIALVIFSIISLLMIIFKWRPFPNASYSLLNSAMFYYELGLVFELMFFLFGLAYKNKKDIITQVKERERLKLEYERQEFEKQMAIMAARNEERDRISADMHDDLGSGVTAIRLMSEIVKSKMKTDQFPEIDKISNSANELLGKMNSIIWTMKSSNDSVESLAAYLRAYATEYFDGTSVDCTVTVNEFIDHELSGEKRRNIFLSFKETLNNILKHANATRVNISIAANEEKLVINVHDNGIGIDLKNLRRFGNGLNNIKKRMQSIQGEFTINSENGTHVCFELDLREKN
jgi:signal transduction histidine kinase